MPQRLKRRPKSAGSSCGRNAAAIFGGVSMVLAGCSGQSTGGVSILQAPASIPPADVAVRTAPVVPGRKARVFIFAGLGDKCEALAAPQITVTAPPAKGDITFVPGQETTIEYSAQGTCLGQKAAGTGVYYTARSGMQGTDQFTVAAKLASGETVSRSFQVTIAD